MIDDLPARPRDAGRRGRVPAERRPAPAARDRPGAAARRAVVVLDEPTAHLDPAVEVGVDAAISGLAGSADRHRRLPSAAAGAIVRPRRGHRRRAARRVGTAGRPAGRRRRVRRARRGLAGRHGAADRGSGVTRPTLARLLGLLSAHRRWIAAGRRSGSWPSRSNVALVAMSAYLVSKAAIVTNVAELALAITAVRVLAIGRAAFRYLERYATHRATLAILADLRVWFFAAIEPLAPARLSTRRSGDLLARIVGRRRDARGLLRPGRRPPDRGGARDRVRLPPAGRVRSVARRRAAGVPRAGRGGPPAADTPPVERGVGRARGPAGRRLRARGRRGRRDWPTWSRSTGPTPIGRSCSPTVPGSTGSPSGLPPSVVSAPRSRSS